MISRKIMMTRNKKKQTLEKLRLATGQILYRLTKVDREYTNREIASESGVDAARISELYLAESTPKTKMSENTLRKLIGGGFVRVSELLKHIKDLTPEEEAYIRKFIVYEDPDLTPTLEGFVDLGEDPGPIMRDALKLRKRGIDVAKLLKDALK